MIINNNKRLNLNANKTQQFFVESGNWCSTIIININKFCDNPADAYAEAATRIIECLSNNIYNNCNSDEESFKLTKLLDEKGANQIDKGFDLPDIEYGILTKIYKPTDNEDTERWIKTSTLFANAGLYEESKKLIELENNWVNS